MTDSFLLRSAALAALAMLPSISTSAQALHGAMTLVLIDDAGNRTAPLAVLGGTIVISRSEPGRSTDNAAEMIAPDRMDIALDPVSATDKRLLMWLARSGTQGKAELSATSDKNTTVYVLWSITSRSVSTTQSQDGAGQTSLVLGAQHASVDNLMLN